VFEIKSLKIIDSFSHGEEEICNFAISKKEEFLITFTKAYMFRVVEIETKEIIKFWKC